MTDADLVARARTGDDAAFGELIDRHRTAVYRAALAALGTHAEADDAAQESFVRAWRRLDGFRGEASFRTWLLSIAWRQALNQRRGRRRWWTRMIPFETRAEAEQDATVWVTAAAGRQAEMNPERLAAGGELREAIRDAIRALSPKLRDALLLAQSGDYSYEEIGVMMRAPIGTIKWRVSEARRLVKRALEKRGHGGLR